MSPSSLKEQQKKKCAKRKDGVVRESKASSSERWKGDLDNAPSLSLPVLIPTRYETQSRRVAIDDEKKREVQIAQWPNIYSTRNSRNREDRQCAATNAVTKTKATRSRVKMGEVRLGETRGKSTPSKESHAHRAVLSKRDNLKGVPSIITTSVKPSQNKVRVRTMTLHDTKKGIEVGIATNSDFESTSFTTEIFQQEESSSADQMTYISHQEAQMRINIPPCNDFDNDMERGTAESMSDLDNHCCLFAESEWVVSRSSNTINRDMVHSSEDSSTSEEEETNKKKGFAISFLEGLLGVAIVFVIVVVFTVFALKKMQILSDGVSSNGLGGSNSTQNVSLNPNEAGKITDAGPASRDSQYFNRLRDALGIAPELDSPQSQALKWLAFADDYFYFDDESKIELLIQRYALVVLHIATGRWDNGGGWATRSGSRQPECYWVGTICKSDDKQVIGLNIGDDVGFLTGTLPSEIGLLTSLEFMYISGSGLTGQIPLSLFDLTNLYAIRLSWGNMTSTISPAISDLKNLQYLQMSGLGLHGKIPSEIGFLTNLRRLSLAYNSDLSGAIPSSFGGLLNLEELLVHGTQLTGTVSSDICELRSLHLEEFWADCTNETSLSKDVTLFCDYPRCCSFCSNS